MLKALFLIAAMPALVWAAGMALTVAGRVVDENGAPVPKARIQVARPDSPGHPLLSTDSDAAGAFHLEIEDRGIYRIQIDCDGYFQFLDPGVRLSEDVPVEIRLNHLKELAESMDVRYSAPAIDPEQTSDTKQLHSPEIQNVPYPASQDYRSALPLMPGAIQDNAGQVHFNGGGTNETNYRLNGFDVSNPASGELAARMNVDTVQTIEWEAGRFSPEAGKGSAGTLEIRTQMGDNHWRFGGTNFLPGLAVQNGLYLSHWSPRLVVSGPIRKGRAWFHNAFDTYYTANTVSQLPPGQNRANSLTATNLTRVHWDIQDKQILTASLLINVNDSRRAGLAFSIRLKRQ